MTKVQVVRNNEVQRARECCELEVRVQGSECVSLAVYGRKVYLRCCMGGCEYWGEGMKCWVRMKI